MTAPLTVTRPAAEQTLYELVAHAPVFLFTAGLTLSWDYVNPPFYGFTGLRAGSALGDGWLAALHPGDGDLVRAAWRAAAQHARPLACEVRFRRHDGAWRWHLVRAAARTRADGVILGWTGSCVDIDDRRAMEVRQGRLLSELQHRIRNILALVRSVLNRTLETSDDMDHFAIHLSGRISALARAQSAAARTADRVIRLDELLHDELMATGGQLESQFRIGGPPVLLPDRVASTIALALHELMANALKFGALSVPGGSVSVRWQYLARGSDAGRLLSLTWQESGVPLMNLQPRRRGFGRELLEQGLPYELGAATKLAFMPGGLCCSIELPLVDDPPVELAP